MLVFRIPSGKEFVLLGPLFLRASAHNGQLRVRLLGDPLHVLSFGSEYLADKVELGCLMNWYKNLLDKTNYTSILADKFGVFSNFALFEFL